MNRPPLLPTILMLLGVGVLCTLGAWQLQRLEWKRGILNALEAEYQKEAEEIKAADLREDLKFKRGFLRGRYLSGKDILIGPRTYDGQAGKNFYTAFALESGEVVFVNKGWVPVNFELPPSYSRKSIIQGVLKPPGEHNMFTPPNDPAKGQWYYPDVSVMAQTLQITEPVLPYVFVLEGDNTDYPRPVAAQIKPNNNHLQYSLFWFTLAGTLVMIYALRFLRKN